MPSSHIAFISVGTLEMSNRTSGVLHVQNVQIRNVIMVYVQVGGVFYL